MSTTSDNEIKKPPVTPTPSPSKSARYVSAQWDPILKGLGVPSNPQNYAVLNAWSQAEGHNNYNNPFNTTLKTSGSVGSFNSVGVQKYKDYPSGVQATINTLQNTRGVGYDKIIAALKSSDPNAAIEAIVRSPWSGSSHYGVGTNGDYTKSSLYKIYSGGKAVPPSVKTTAVKPSKTTVTQDVTKPTPSPSPGPAPVAPSTKVASASGTSASPAVVSGTSADTFAPTTTNRIIGMS